MLVRALEPQLSNRVTGNVDAAPWMEIAYSPRFARNLHGGMLDGHRLS
jgi:hypothetical protein